MRLKALVSFAGKVSMYAGEVREVVEEHIAKDLIRAGYAEEVKTHEAEVVEKPVEKAAETSAKSSNKTAKKKK